jgi:hypothetical protein
MIMIEFWNGEARFVPEPDGHLDIEKCKAELRSLQVPKDLEAIELSESDGC